MKVLLANPRGFCAGVDRAIEIVDRTLELFGAPIYVRHEVVHNRFVVDTLKSKGAVFVDELSEVPDGSIAIFSAHGVSKTVRQEGTSRGLKIFDATCPLVTKVHIEVTNHCKKGLDVILIGHKGHPEVEGTLGQWDTECADGHIYLIDTPDAVQALQVSQPENVAYVSQTTLSVDDTQEVIDALKLKYPSIKSPRKDDICYATQNRQNAVRLLSQACQVILVVGSPNSSNSNRLRELAIKQGVNAYLIDGPQFIKDEWLSDELTIGVTAGASAPESLVQAVIKHLKDKGAQHVDELQGIEENIVFALPRDLRVQN